MLLKDSRDFGAQGWGFFKLQRSAEGNIYLDSFSLSCVIIQPSHNLANEPSCQIGQNLLIQTYFIYPLSFPLFSRWESHKDKSLLPTYVMLVSAQEAHRDSSGVDMRRPAFLQVACHAQRDLSQKHCSS